MNEQNWNIKKVSPEELAKLQESNSTGREKRRKWPWSKMEVGELVEFTLTDELTFRIVNDAAYYHGVARGRRFTVRNEGDKAVVIRIA